MHGWLSDDRFTLAQTNFALAALAAAYVAAGRNAGGLLVLLPMILSMGAFALSKCQLQGVAASGASMLLAATVWRARHPPAGYEPHLDALNWIAAAAVLAATCRTGIHMGQLRKGLLSHRKELRDALERIRALATCDDLTGLLNRRAVMERLQIELRERAADAPRLCVALIDLDHFKRVNDTLGHGAGDEVLRRFAEAARREVRCTDVLARWGGEEFLVMMPGGSGEQALGSLDRIRVRLADWPMNDIQPGLRITFSAGVAQCAGREDIERAIERADAAMYAAKAAGRNRTLLAGMD